MTDNESLERSRKDLIAHLAMLWNPVSAKLLVNALDAYLAEVSSTPGWTAKQKEKKNDK